MGGGALTLRHDLAQARGAIVAGGWELVPLRLLVGYGFAAHGYAKLARAGSRWIDSALGGSLD